MELVIPAPVVSDVARLRYRDAAARCLATKLGPSWASRSTLRRELNSRVRGYFDDAIAYLVAAGQAEQETADNGRGVTGMKYRASAPGIVVHGSECDPGSGGWQWAVVIEYGCGIDPADSADAVHYIFGPFPA